MVVNWNLVKIMCFNTMFDKMSLQSRERRFSSRGEQKRRSGRGKL